MAFPDDLDNRSFSNEAEVESCFVLPLLHHLGYTDDDIAPKYPVTFQTGRRGRHHEADFAVFDGNTHSKNTSLLVVEAKGPDEELGNGKEQGESYAANLRAPFLLLTNGRVYELWQIQISTESYLVLSGSVSSIKGKLGELDLLISKPAAIEYALSLRQKPVGGTSIELGPYYRAELTRTNGQFAIARQLYPFGGNGSDKILSSEILEKLPSGAVILGPSGYGKSILSVSLLRQLIEECLSAESFLPILHLELQDVAAANKTIVQYATDRLSAHCPQISESGLRHLFRHEGGVLICDGFDRLIQSERDNFLAQLKNLWRDHPKLQLFVFSRTSMRPEIGLPIFELREYSDEEQLEYAKLLLGSQEGHPSFHISLIPKALDSLFKIPLLFQIGFHHWLIHLNFPTDLNTLFRSWIENLLKTKTLSSTQRINREHGLRLFANQSVGGSMRSDKVMVLFRTHGLPDTLLDDLVQSDALRMDAYSVELTHEALGDYLRAAELAESDPDGLSRDLRTVELDTDSMFPILLAAQLGQHQLQRILFTRLAAIDLPTYFNALRYRSDLSLEVLSKTQEEFAKTYLEDLLDGIEQPLEAFFPQVSGDVRQSLIGSSSPAVSVVGNGSSEWINYSFLPAGTGPRIAIGPTVDQHRIRDSNLKLIGLRADSGRVLGVKILKDEVLQMPEERRLLGGIEWRSEKLVGWIRFLSHQSSLGIDLGQTLDQLSSALRPLVGQVIPIGFGSFSQKRILIDIALEDIAELQNRGDTHLNVWWTKFGNAHLDPLENEENTRRLFNEFYRRVQIIYREVIEHSFNPISASFGFYDSLPVRWDIAIRIHQDPWRPPWGHYSWRPVESWEEAGADLEFTEKTPERFLNWDFLVVQEALRKFGRLTPSFRIWMGNGILPRFDGNSMTGGFDGETPVIEEVCNYIKKDLKHLFKSCPSGDIPYPEQYI